jgi:hypothetical protein
MTNLSRTIRSACREEHRERSTSSSLLHHLRSFLVDRLIITSTNTHTKEKKKTRQPAARAVFIQRDPRAALRKGEREWKGEKKGEGRTGLGVLSLDLETPEVSETSVGPDLLESLEVLSHLLVDLVGDDVGVLAVGDVLLPVKEPGGYTNATERGRQREREKSVWACWSKKGEGMVGVKKKGRRDERILNWAGFCMMVTIRSSSSELSSPALKEFEGRGLGRIGRESEVMSGKGERMRIVAMCARSESNWADTTRG